MDSVFAGLLGEFLLDGKERLARLEALLLDLVSLTGEDWHERMAEARREWHTLKGNAGMMGLTELQALAHEAEDRLETLAPGEGDVHPVLQLVDRFLQGMEALRQSPAGRRKSEGGKIGEMELAAGRDGHEAESQVGSVRVPFSALDELVDLLAEMVIFRNRLADTVGRGRFSPDAVRAWDEVESAQESLGKTLGFIQDRIMRLRLVPLQSLFGHLRRIVFEEGRRGEKEVRFETQGGDTPMDKALLEVASEALGHLVRNAVIHGIEPARTRRSAGKSAAGTVRLAASTHSTEVQIEVRDDGGGIDRAALVAAAERKGMAFKVGEDPYSLLFRTGFSTREATDLSSGRGVGLSAAQESVQKLGGRIEVESSEGRGSCFCIRLPLSVSITRALLVRVDGEEYALPLSAIVESLHFRPGDGHDINHAGAYKWRGGVIPLVDLGVVFGSARARRERGYVVILEAEGRTRGLIGDDLTGIKEIVVKGLDETTGNPAGVAGATILGDGRVVLILDPQGLMGLKPFVEDGRTA